MRIRKGGNEQLTFYLPAFTTQITAKTRKAVFAATVVAFAMIHLIRVPSSPTPDLHPTKPRPESLLPHNVTTSPTADLHPTASIPHSDIVPVFYNVYAKADRISPTTSIIKEQMAQLRPEHKVFV